MSTLFYKIASVGKNPIKGKFILYGYDSCPYTIKMKDELRKNNINFQYKQIDKNEEYNKEYQSYKVSGVPLLVNLQTKNHIVGFRPIDKLEL